MDQHNLNLDALPAQLLRFVLDRRDLIQELQPGRSSRTDQLGRLFQLDPDDADPQVAIVEDVRALHPIWIPQPVASSDDVGAQEGEVGARLMLKQPRDTIVEFVVTIRGGMQTPRVFYIDRRPILQQTGIRRRSADIVTRGKQERRPGELRGLLIEHRRQLRRAADGYVLPSIV